MAAMGFNSVRVELTERRNANGERQPVLSRQIALELRGSSRADENIDPALTIELRNGIVEAVEVFRYGDGYGLYRPS
ncbi:MAG: hypothetical protein ACLSVD_03160 [Eggerthellaceae bacterium]